MYRNEEKERNGSYVNKSKVAIVMKMESEKGMGKKEGAWKRRMEKGLR